MTTDQTTLQLLDELTGRFFGLFSNKDGITPGIDDIDELFIPGAVIIKNTGTAPEIYTLEKFAAPRKKILTDGTLVDFSEEEISGRTEIFGNIAHRFCSYKKSGILSGQAFETKGMKTIQFIKTPGGWKISSLAWDDEREGLTIK
ncbi:MAG TPA: hypothetical protein VGO58_00170 [Chitinophagaceae bacterium]|jgi:hypothetical protein|nr:hypothetical protein [Chitinophagaceae bacterium]